MSWRWMDRYCHCTFLGMILEPFETHGRKKCSKFEIGWDPLWKTSYLQYQSFLEEWPSISIFPTRQRSSVALSILDQEMGSLRTLGLPRCNHRATAKCELPNSSNLECWKWHSSRWKWWKWLLFNESNLKWHFFRVSHAGSWWEWVNWCLF